MSTLVRAAFRAWKMTTGAIWLQAITYICPSLYKNAAFVVQNMFFASWIKTAMEFTFFSLATLGIEVLEEFFGYRVSADSLLTCVTCVAFLEKKSHVINRLKSRMTKVIKSWLRVKSK